MQLLPNKYKKFGWLIMLCSVVFLVLSKNSGLPLNQIEDIGSIIAIIGFILTLRSKEKVEDERTALCRYKANSMAFFSIIACILTANIVDLFDPFDSIFSNPNSARDSIFGKPMGLLYFSAIAYHFYFGLLIKK